jgi:dihydroorotate dehydrogenase
MILFISPPFGNWIRLPHTQSILGTYTLYERKGKIWNIMTKVFYSPKYNGWINNIGLRNKGIYQGLKKYKNNDILNISILNEEELVLMKKIIPDDVNLEINISCPNVDDNGLYDKGIEIFLNPKRKWCILKLSPTTSHKQIDEYYNKGFRQFNCGNTLKVLEGGLSGSMLKDFHSINIRYIKTQYPEAIVIATGGIRNWKDIIYYKKSGCNHISVSSTLLNPFCFVVLYIRYIYELYFGYGV